MVRFPTVFVLNNVQHSLKHSSSNILSNGVVAHGLQSLDGFAEVSGS